MPPKKTTKAAEADAQKTEKPAEVVEKPVEEAKPEVEKVAEAPAEVTPAAEPEVQETPAEVVAEVPAPDVEVISPEGEVIATVPQEVAVGHTKVVIPAPAEIYKENLEQANWDVADKHIEPIDVVKIDGEQQPPAEDFEAIQEELANTPTDPTETIVTTGGAVDAETLIGPALAAWAANHGGPSPEQIEAKRKQLLAELP